MRRRRGKGEGCVRRRKVCRRLANWSERRKSVMHNVVTNSLTKLITDMLNKLTTNIFMEEEKQGMHLQKEGMHLQKEGMHLQKERQRHG